MARHQRHDQVPVPTGRLWRDVLQARATLGRVRDSQGLRTDTRAAVEAARSDLLAALEAYAARLDSEGIPLPYRLRDELRLHAALVAAWRH